MINVNNVIMGNLNMEIIGEVNGQNHKSGEKCLLNFHSKTWNKGPKVTGFSYDKNGNKAYEVSGSWIDEVFATNVKTGKKEKIWSGAS